MAHFLILIIFVIWLLPTPQAGWTLPAATGMAVTFGGYLALILFFRIWATRVARDFRNPGRLTNLNRFNKTVFFVRFAIPLWFALCIFGPPHWKHIVMRYVFELGVPMRGSHEPLLILPAFLLGIIPPLLGWTGIWYAAFPADNSIREQHLADQIELGLPAHPPPTFAQYFNAQIRQQVLFILVPIALALGLHDLFLAVLHHYDVRRLIPIRGISSETLDEILTLPAAAIVFIFAPALIVCILGAAPLPPGPLRTRLESICQRIGLRYREILLWHTNYTLGNAGVMGLLPIARYILLSDLLLERMDDRQIEAVFAHELGHLVYRHFLWFVLFFVTLMMVSVGPGTMISDGLEQYLRATLHISADQAGTLLEIFFSVIGFILIMLLFGYLSRRFERQADVFAARMLQSNWGSDPAPALPQTAQGAVALAPDFVAAIQVPLRRTYVGEYGAAIVSGALQRVAEINNMPTNDRFTWRHDNIDTRKRHLLHMSADPANTMQFDALMRRLQLTLVLALVAFGLWATFAVMCS